jgi:hypothetical protein
VEPEAEIPFWVEDQQSVSILPASIAGRLLNSNVPLLPLNPDTAISKSTEGRIIFPLSSDHLITLLQYNVLRGCITNRAIISSQIPNAMSSCSTEDLHILPFPSSPQYVPPSLLPTHLQQTMPHEDWVDIIPHPRWRDNILRALGTFDEDDLWSDTIGGLFEGFPDCEVHKRGLIVWDSPWDPRGWEVSEGFWRKWKWAFEGCEDSLETTNKWRRLRGEKPLVLDA